MTRGTSNVGIAIGLSSAAAAYLFLTSFEASRTYAAFIGLNITAIIAFIGIVFFGIAANWYTFLYNSLIDNEDKISKKIIESLYIFKIFLITDNKNSDKK